MHLAILGGGSWGTALGVHLARNGHSVKIWEFFGTQAQEMQEKRICKLLPGVHLPPTIFVSAQMEEVLSGCSVVFLVVPSDKAENAMQQAAPFLQKQPVVICSKGFTGGRFLSEVVREQIAGPVYCLLGPTHAEEVGKGLFSGIVLAGGEGKEKLQEMIASASLRVDLSSDLVGVQVCAALKNIVAILIGVLDGLGWGDNAKAYFMTKGLSEIRSIGLALGAQEETFHGLAGMGDLIVTCSSKHSRNRFVGEQVGKGRELQ
ncbi:MAG: NAD(P)H-dependent glycerol-3-phosphate dehydrogenase, partial [Nanoarchaeota archaeon]|nr:NAD(P)H-dependent glycerol-3-phosphate dehydrogenase [Nanoarchaeota archaeon]